jgi:hypothetical protein
VPGPEPRRPWQALAAVYAFVGGAVANALVFVIPWFAALAAGLAITFSLATATALRQRASEAARITEAYSAAFVMLIWPVLFFVALALWGGWQ